MSETLEQIAKNLKDKKGKTKRKESSEYEITIQLIYAFNGTGKTRLSKEFQKLVSNYLNTSEETEDKEQEKRKFLYYSAYTEDLFYWDNDIENNAEPKLKIQNNNFTNWILKDQGKGNAIIEKFQHYVNNNKLMPLFNPEGNEVTFSYKKGDDTSSNNIKISKGEESLFIWCVFYSIFEQVIEELNISEVEERESDQFNDLEYIFIDDPVTSLDENHLIELAVDLARLIKSSKSELKFIITTHNPLFYNVLYNEFKQDKFKKYILNKNESGTFELMEQNNDSPFSYHLFLKNEIEKAIETGVIYKCHFNYLRNILEKTSTFLGKENWTDLLPKNEDNKINPYESRIINISSHSKHSAEETYIINDSDKRVLEYLIKKVNEIYNIKITDNSKTQREESNAQ
ncbi:AAA family ATPase [bacterium]|nr:AAA family ATPase [bacterium]